MLKKKNNTRRHKQKCANEKKTKKQHTSLVETINSSELAEVVKLIEPESTHHALVCITRTVYINYITIFLSLGIPNGSVLEFIKFFLKKRQKFKY